MQAGAIADWVGVVAAMIAAIAGGIAAWFAVKATRRQAERHDVFWEGRWNFWEGRWNAPGEYIMVNRGDRDTAYNVDVIVAVDEEEARAHHDRVGPGEYITLALRRAREQFLRQRDDDQADFPYVPAQRNMHFISERVLWETKLGVPHTHESTDPMGSGGPDNDD